jgi:predicted RNA methylase
MYNYTSHVNMLNDNNRMYFYNEKIRKNKNIRNKTCCDIGSGTGILALFALHAGAKHVYLIEEQTQMNEVIVALMNENNINENKYTIINEMSNKAELPEKIDVIIHELIGIWGNGEQGLSYVCDIRDRFLINDGLIIPDLIEVHITLQANNELYKQKYNTQPFLNDISFNNCLNTLHSVSNNYAHYCLNRQIHIKNDDRYYIQNTSDCNIEIIKYDLMNDKKYDIDNLTKLCIFKPNTNIIVSLLSTVKYYCNTDPHIYGDSYSNHGNWEKQIIPFKPVTHDVIYGTINIKNNNRSSNKSLISISLIHDKINILNCNFST